MIHVRPLFSLSVIFSFAFVVLFSACGTDDDGGYDCWDGNNLLLNIEGNVGIGENFALDAPFVNLNEQEVELDLFKFYLSDIRLVRDDFSEVDVTDILLHNFKDSLTHDFALPAGTYQSIKLGIGVSPDLNESDPVTFDDDHPLSYTQDTYWTWSTQYKFVMIEGRFTESYNPEGTITTFSYHTGTDSLYRTLEIPKLFTLYDDQRTQVDLTIDIRDIFKNINMLEDNFTHTVGDTFILANNITNNFKNALR